LLAAGLSDVTFKRFSYAYFWQNLWAYILESQRW